MKSIDKVKTKLVEILLKKIDLLQEDKAGNWYQHWQKISQINQNLRDRRDKNNLKAKNGRPRKIDSRGERKLVRLIASGKCDTAAAIKNEV